MEIYPTEATEKFDDATFHRKYCLSFVRKYIQGDVLEVGAGCGSFTRDYIDNNLKFTLTETDKKNYDDLIKIFENNKNVEVEDKKIFQMKKNLTLFCTYMF